MAEAPGYDIELTHTFNATPERVFRAFTDPEQFAMWYGPDGFPARADSVEIDPQAGGTHRFAMESEADPSIRTAFDGHVTEVVPDQLVAISGSWVGIPGLSGPWPSHLRVEFHAEGGATRVLLREGPHPTGTAELGYQAWEMMFVKLDAMLGG